MRSMLYSPGRRLPEPRQLWLGQATMELIVALPVAERDMVLGILSPAANPDPLKLIGHAT